MNIQFESFYKVLTNTLNEYKSYQVIFLSLLNG